MQDDPYADRKKLTFAQAEGAEPLPRQLALKEISPELRARLWQIIHASLTRFKAVNQYAPSSLREPWSSILYRKHVIRDHRMADEFENSFQDLARSLKQTFTHGTYAHVLDLTQWLLRQPDCPINPAVVQIALNESRAAYRLLDDEKTIVPIASDVERETLNRAFVDLAAAEFHGAHAHLQAAAEHLTTGTLADSIRESIHAVESVARTIGGTGSLAGALQKLASKSYVHPALKSSFTALYGFTSDEKGTRHPLLDGGAAKVDETDAILMIGACAAFVSYMIGKHRNAADAAGT